MDKMIINLTLNLPTDISAMKEWIDTILEPGVIVQNKITRTTRFTKNSYNDEETCTHFKRIELKLSVPLDQYAVDYPGSSFSRICAKYIDEIMQLYQYRYANQKQTETPSLEDHEIKFAHWKPNTSLPYWSAGIGNNQAQDRWTKATNDARRSMYDTNSYITDKS